MSKIQKIGGAISLISAYTLITIIAFNNTEDFISGIKCAFNGCLLMTCVIGIVSGWNMFITAD